jgi:membrane protein
MILNLIIKNFSAGDKPVSAEMITSTLKIPVRLVRDLLEDLNKSGLVSVIHENEHKEWLYQPAMDINKLSVNFVLRRLDNKGSEHMVFLKSKEYDKVNLMLDRFDKLVADSESNILVRDLL